VMTAHVYNRHLDAWAPATLSRPTIDCVLRGQLGWRGVVVSDDMRMGAIEQRFSALEARFASLEEQMIGANQRLDRIERRLDLVDAAA